MCGNKLLFSTQWELSAQRLPDWEILSVGEVVKVCCVSNEVDWDCCWHISICSLEIPVFRNVLFQLEYCMYEVSHTPWHSCCNYVRIHLMY